MSSSWIERRRRNTYDEIAEARAEVERRGRHATAEHEPDSYYVRPNAMPLLATFDQGVSSAVRSHFEREGLHQLAGTVDDLERLGRKVMKRYETSDTVSDFVYEMY